MSGGTPPTRRASGVHPIAILLLPIPAIIAVLFADGIALSLLLLAACLVLALAKGPRFTFGVIRIITGGVALMWFGFSLAAPAAGDTSGPLIDGLPFSPSIEQSSFALRGALRIVTVVTLYIVTIAFVRGQGGSP